MSAAFWACSHWRRSSAQPRSRMPAPPPSKWECMSTALSVSYLERGPQLSLRQVDPLIRELVHYRDLKVVEEALGLDATRISQSHS